VLETKYPYIYKQQLGVKDQKENYEGHLNREDTNPYNDRSIHQEKRKKKAMIEIFRRVNLFRFIKVTIIIITSLDFFIYSDDRL
jgi:hypothetical protein